jgi:FkbM family methyltransferase
MFIINRVQLCSVFLKIKQKVVKFQRLCPFWDIISILLLRLATVMDRKKEFTIHPKALGGKPLYCRSNTQDYGTFVSTFWWKYHMSAVELVKPDYIIDLGANVGYTAAHLADTYKTATVIAVEMEPANCKLVEKNLRHWKDRAEVVPAAIWSEDGLQGKIEGLNSDSFTFSEGCGKDDELQVKTLTMNHLIKMFLIDSIDFLKIDIEGAEKEILLNSEPDWLTRVQSVNLEIHDRSEMKSYIALFEKYNFEVREHPTHWCSLLALK